MDLLTSKRNLFIAVTFAVVLVSLGLGERLL
jgi:hypothetical protein